LQIGQLIRLAELRRTVLGEVLSAGQYEAHAAPADVAEPNVEPGEVPADYQIERVRMLRQF